MQEKNSTKGIISILLLLLLSSCSTPISKLAVRIKDVVDAETEYQVEVRMLKHLLPTHWAPRRLSMVLRNDTLYRAIYVKGADTLQYCDYYWKRFTAPKNSEAYADVEKGCLFLDKLSMVDKSFTPYFMHRTERACILAGFKSKTLFGFYDKEGIAIIISDNLEQTLAHYDSVHYKNVVPESTRISLYQEIIPNSVFVRTWKYFDEGLVYDSEKLTPQLWLIEGNRIYESQ